MKRGGPGAALGATAIALLFAFLAAPRVTLAGESVRVLAAASFRDCLTALADSFTAHGGPPVVISSGSTGGLYAQIVAGAPCDLFFAADSARPERLAAEGWAREVRPCARGQLVFCARQAWPNPGGHAGGVAVVLDQLAKDPGTRLAVADPDLAPYGLAARQTLDAVGRFAAWSDRLVTGRDVGQTWQFLAAGAVPAAFVARSQVEALRRTDPAAVPGTVILVPADLHLPLVQSVAVRADAPPAADRFLDFVLDPDGAAVLAAFGFLPVPQP